MNNTKFNTLLRTNSLVEDVEIEESILIQGVVRGKNQIRNITFKNSVNLSGANIGETLIFEDCCFELIGANNCLEISNCSGGELWFQNCDFLGNVRVNALSGGTLVLNGCILSGEFSVANGVDYCSINIGGTNKRKTTLRKGLDIISGFYHAISIRDVNCAGKMTFHPATINQIFFGNGNYNEVNFYNFKALASLTLRADTTERSDLILKKITAPYLGLQGSILFQNVQIHELDFSPFNQNEGKVKIQNVEFVDRFIITDSDLGRILFNEVDFTNAKLCLDNTYIGDCVFSNIKWPVGRRVMSFMEISNAELTSASAKLKNTLILKEVYRQLKNITKAQSNNIDALDFYRNEMAEYWNEIKVDPNVSQWEKFIVWISKATSNFGLSLKKPFWLLVGFHVFLFTLMVWEGYDGMRFSFSSFDWEQIEKGFGNFFSLINPVHKYLDTSDGWVLTIDFFMRLFSGFFTYHIIRATRKHAKL